MKYYNPDIRSGIHKIQVTIQQWEYKGHLIVNMGGNCHGRDVLNFDFECNNPPENNDCQFGYDEVNNRFSATLEDDNGNELYVSGDANNFNEMMVAIEFLEYRRKGSE